MTNEELTSIFQDHARRHRGELDPRVVEETVRRDRNHPLRGELEWNRDRASVEYRVVQISQLIRRCRIEVVARPVSIRAPAFAPSPDKPRTYETINRSQSRPPDERREILVKEIEPIVGKLKRLRSMAVALDVTDELSRVEDAVSTLLARIQPTIGSRPAGNG